MFLSKEESAVKNAIANDISAGLIYGGPEKPEPLDGTPIFAFDGDSGLFSADADNVFKEKNIEGFEFDNLMTALPPGPLHKFALALEELRAGRSIDDPPFRIALVIPEIFCSFQPHSTRDHLRGWDAGLRQSWWELPGGRPQNVLEIYLGRPTVNHSRRQGISVSSERLA